MHTPATVLHPSTIQLPRVHAFPAVVALVVLQARVLESVLAAGLGWDFSMSELHLDSDSEDEGDEYGPVVVDLTEQQLAELEAQGQ